MTSKAQPNTVTKPTRSQIESFYNTNLKTQEVADRLGITKSHLFHLIRAYGIPTRSQVKKRKINGIDRAEFKQFYYDPRVTQKQLCQHFGIDKPANLNYIAVDLGLLTRLELEARGIVFLKTQDERMNHNCDTCPHRPWCDAHPCADKLPCETEPTPYVEREVSIYHSPNGGVALALPLVWEEEDSCWVNEVE